MPLHSSARPAGSASGRPTFGTPNFFHSKSTGYQQDFHSGVEDDVLAGAADGRWGAGVWLICNRVWLADHANSRESRGQVSSNGQCVRIDTTKSVN